MSKKNSKKILWAFIWIAVGVIWLMSNYGKFPYSFSWSKDWPVIFIIIGLATFFKLITCSVKAEKKGSCTINFGNGKNKNNDKYSGNKAEWLKIRVYEDNKEIPKVKINLPVSVIKSAVKIGGKFNLSIPENAKEKMAEKGVNLDAEMFENIDELFEQFAKNGKYKIIDVVDEEEGSHVEVYVE